jgi:FixJ family two-component response regulator
MRFRRSAAAATRLTMRERQVLALLVRGASCADAATELGLGIREVESHRAELITKLEAMAAGDQASAGASGRFASAASMSASENSGSSSVPAKNAS